jgi:predicted Zn-dependent protease
LNGFRSLRSPAPFWSLRQHDETREVLAVRQDTIEPPRLSVDRGAMLTAVTEGGYCATSDLSAAGLQAALDKATAWAQAEAAIDAVLLAGTELALLMREDSYEGVPVVHSTRAHVEMAVSALLS